MNRPDHNAVIDAALNRSIAEMLAELGDPPLVGRLFPQGWSDAPRERRINLHALCISTFRSREARSLGDTGREGVGAIPEPANLGRADALRDGHAEPSAAGEP